MAECIDKTPSHPVQSFPVIARSSDDPAKVRVVAMASQTRSARRVPLYQQTADALRELIASGTFDSVLPSQDALCEILQVSRPTVREAIRVLERTGLVVSRQGVGTVINH